MRKVTIRHVLAVLAIALTLALLPFPAGAAASGTTTELPGQSVRNADGSGSTASANHRWPDRLRELPPRERPNQTDPAAFAAAYREIVARAHARGIRVVGGTITPYGGNGGWTAAREAVRQSVNDLIRYGGIFDAVADFDAAVRDPDAPERILPAFDSGDHLHFNDAGLQATADAIDLSSLTRKNTR